MAYCVSYKQLIPGARLLKPNTQAITSQSNDTSTAPFQNTNFLVNGDRSFSQIWGQRFTFFPPPKQYYSHINIYEEKRLLDLHLGGPCIFSGIGWHELHRTWNSYQNLPRWNVNPLLVNFLGLPGLFLLFFLYTYIFLHALHY